MERLTLGGVCSCGPALRIMEAKLGEGNLISRSLALLDDSPRDGRTRYPLKERAAIYSHLLATIRRLRPEQTCALCMEDPALAKDLRLGKSNVGCCNCLV